MRRTIIVVFEALVVSLLLCEGSFATLSGHREASSSSEDRDDVVLSRDTSGSGGESGSIEERGHHYHKHHAHSFQHFSGPVSAHHQEVSWKDKHGHHHHDFKAHPEHKYHHSVEDHHTKDFHGQKEHHDASSSSEDQDDVILSRNAGGSGGESGSVEERGHHHHKHHAHSFQHFHGPVSGHHQEVSWKDKHGHHHHDFKAHPEYKYHYGVEDHHTKDFHGQKEHRDGKEVHGEYSIHEPGGNVRTVKYYSNHHGGFYAVVHNHGGNDHSGGTYGGKH